jgi:hypothetical protein
MLYRKIGSAYQVQRDFEVETLVVGFDITHELYHIQVDGLLSIHKYYAWDGPSGAFHTKTFVKSSCVHDVLCELINAGLIPMEDQVLADETMYSLNKEAGMWLLRRLWTFAAVRYYQAKKKILTGKPIIYEV